MSVGSRGDPCGPPYESVTFLTSVPKLAAKSNIVVITDLTRQSDMKSNLIHDNISCAWSH